MFSPLVILNSATFWDAIILLFLILSFLLPILALIHLFKKNKNRDDRGFWAIIIVIFPILGPVIYFFQKGNRNF